MCHHDMVEGNGSWLSIIFDCVMLRTTTRNGPLYGGLRTVSLWTNSCGCRVGTV